MSTSLRIRREVSEPHLLAAGTHFGSFKATVEYRDIHALLNMSPRFDVFRHFATPSRRVLTQGLCPPIALWNPPGSGAGDGTDGAGDRAESGAVLWGWGLLRHAAACGLSRLAVRHVTCDAREAILLMLELEGGGGREADYSWAELAALSDLCASLGVELDREISRAATGDGALAAKLARYRALPEQLGADLDAGRVDLRTAEQLAAHAADEACDAVARTEHLSFSKRRQLLRLAVETLRREQRRPQQSRGSGGALSLVDLIDDAMAHPDPVSAISKRRYPSFTELSDRLDTIRVETIEKSGVELSEPPYFEGERYTVQFSFANGEELERRIAALERLKTRTRELQDLL